MNQWEALFEACRKCQRLARFFDKFRDPTTSFWHPGLTMRQKILHPGLKCLLHISCAMYCSMCCAVEVEGISKTQTRSTKQFVNASGALDFSINLEKNERKLLSRLLLHRGIPQVWLWAKKSLAHSVPSRSSAKFKMGTSDTFLTCEYGGNNNKLVTKSWHASRRRLHVFF